jgi:hypothetical protein
MTHSADRGDDLCAAPTVTIVQRNPDYPYQLHRFLSLRSPEVRASIFFLTFSLSIYS